ncbi:MAG TPA: serine hydrolase domain-containing protein, partial [Xanthomonadales bacterium]|nr:serine hydrolase domain-containing protein [Xanthomonadales bacterium]
TAAAIMKLVERGKLHLDDPLHRYLPGVVPDEVAKGVTIRQLLMHTAGIFEYTAIPEFEALATQALPRDRLVELIAGAPPSFQPGKAQAYSNSGFLLLGLVVEKVSGKPWGRYIEDVIFPLAGMRDSRASWNAQVVPRLATGYEFDDERGLRRAPHHEPEWIHGNGGLRSTARDMTQWMQALHGGKVLGADAYREMTTPGTLADGTKLRYGLGIVVGQPLLGHPVLRHGGTFPGYTGYTAYLPAHELAISVLVNTNHPNLDEDAIASEIVEHLLGDRAAEPGGAPFTAGDSVGRYRGNVLRSKRAVEVGVDAEGRLTAAIPEWGEEPRPLVHLGDDQFTAGWLDYQFLRKDGAVVSVRRVSSDTNILFER